MKSGIIDAKYSLLMGRCVARHFLTRSGHSGILALRIPGAGLWISRLWGLNRFMRAWEEVCNSPEHTVDYWGKLIRFCMRFGSRCILFSGKEIQFFFLFFF